jgi:hypothetical protein
LYMSPAMNKESVRTYRVRVGGVFARATFIDRSNGAECDRDPESPAKSITSPFTVGALAAADRRTGCSVPTLKLKLDGEAVTPAGKLVAWTLICEENPFIAVADTVTGNDSPGLRFALTGLTIKLKSGVGG